MGFPILSLIATGIIGIPQSLLLRVLGFPNSYPGSMGFPMPFSAFLRRSFFFFYGFFGIPQFSPGVYGIPHALLRLSPKAFFFLSIWISSFLSFAAFEGLVHWLDIGDTSRDIHCFFQNSFLRGIHNPFLLRGIIQSFSNGLTQISTRIFEFPLSPRN